MEWTNVFLEIDQIYITEILVYHYHNTINLCSQDVNSIIIKPMYLEDYNCIFLSDKHKIDFYNKIKKYNINVRNFNIFSQNFSHLLCTELLDYVFKFVIH